MGAPLPRYERVVASLGSAVARAPRLLEHRERGVSDPRLGPRDRGAPPGHRSSGRRGLGRARARRRARALLAGRDRQRGRAVACGALLGRAGRALPHRRRSGVEPGPRAGSRRRRRGHQRCRRLRGLRLGRRRAGQGDLAQHRGDLDRRRRARARRSRRSLRRRSDARPGTRGARRCDAPRAAGRRPPHGVGDRRAGRRGHGAVRRLLVARWRAIIGSR